MHLQMAWIVATVKLKVAANVLKVQESMAVDETSNGYLELVSCGFCLFICWFSFGFCFVEFFLEVMVINIILFSHSNSFSRPDQLFPGVMIFLLLSYEEEWKSVDGQCCNPSRSLERVSR